MINNPIIPELGKITVYEVYDFYDEPVLFVARTELDNLFLVVMSEDKSN
jgi:hypothetical protein